VKLAPHLHRLGSDLVNSYLVEDGGGVTIIDAGLPGLWKELPAELAAMGRSLGDIRAIVLTHGDTDHIGYAERLRRERGVPVYVHELDAALARGEVKKPSTGWGPIRIAPLLRFLWYGARRGGLRTPPVTEVSTFTDGQILDLPGSPRVIHVPGHTPGSVAIHVPAVDALFVGDALTRPRADRPARSAPRALHHPAADGDRVAGETGGRASELAAPRTRRALAWGSG